MSLGEELALEQKIESNLYWTNLYQKIEQDAFEGIWTTRDGRKVPVSKMSIGHYSTYKQQLKNFQKVSIFENYFIPLHHKTYTKLLNWNKSSR